MLTELLGRIMKQEGRHIDFYGSRGREPTRGEHQGAEGHPVRAQALLGAGRHRRHAQGRDATFMIGHLFGGDDGRAVAERIDRRIDRLPGLAGLDLATGARAKYAAA